VDIAWDFSAVGVSISYDSVRRSQSNGLRVGIPVGMPPAIFV